MRRPPPISTLFPYTTLFRSVRRFDRHYRDAYDKVQSGAIGEPFLVKSQTTDKHDPSGFFVQFAQKSGGIFLEDRKSTRLNSSHSQISYAVFCLKKKKK